MELNGTNWRQRFGKKKREQLESLREEMGLARRLPYINLQLCIALKLLSKRGSVRMRSRGVGGSDGEDQKGGKDEEDSFICHGRSLFLHV